MKHGSRKNCDFWNAGIGDRSSAAVPKRLLKKAPYFGEMEDAVQKLRRFLHRLSQSRIAKEFSLFKGFDLPTCGTAKSNESGVFVSSRAQRSGVCARNRTKRSSGSEPLAGNRSPFSVRMPSLLTGSIGGESADEQEHESTSTAKLSTRSSHTVRGVFDCERQDESKRPDPFEFSVPALTSFFEIFVRLGAVPATHTKQ